jgi:hypothetical protein
MRRDVEENREFFDKNIKIKLAKILVILKNFFATF